MVCEDPVCFTILFIADPTQGINVYDRGHWSGFSEEIGKKTTQDKKPHVKSDHHQNVEMTPICIFHRALWTNGGFKIIENMTEAYD